MRAELQSVRTQVDIYKKWVTDHFTPLLCINLWGLALFVLVFLLTQTSAHYKFPSFISFFHSFLLYCLSLVELFFLGWMKICQFFFQPVKTKFNPCNESQVIVFIIIYTLHFLCNYILCWYWSCLRCTDAHTWTDTQIIIYLNYLTINKTFTRVIAKKDIASLRCSNNSICTKQRIWKYLFKKEFNVPKVHN